MATGESVNFKALRTAVLFPSAGKIDSIKTIDLQFSGTELGIVAENVRLSDMHKGPMVS